MYDKSIDDVLKEFSTDKNNGLSNEEAKIRLEKNGPNKLSSKKPKTLLNIFFAQINDAMIYILIVAAIISAIMGEYSDAIVIIIVILINAIIGVAQESRAEKALSALKELSTPKALVKRNGEIIEIPSEEVVLGDIVVIDAGRYIPCDLRLIQTANLKIEESAFTGESLPSDKNADKVFDSNDVPVGDRENMAYMSTLATYGRGMGVCVATAMDTEIGKIAKMIENEEADLTPLQKKLSSLGKILGIASIIICVLIFVIGLLQGRDTFEMALTAISLAVAAIPEGLPAIVAIVLALGVQRMIKQNAIVKKLPAVETLGSVNVICSDKTGTLTLNKMTVRKIYDNNSISSVNDISELSENSKLLLETMILCNDATLSEKGNTGDPTEIALLDVGIRFNYYKTELNNKYARIDEIPFDSDRKLMSTVNMVNSKLVLFTKGALDVLINKVNYVADSQGIRKLSDEEKKEIISVNKKLSEQGLRVLAFAYKELQDREEITKEDENNYIFTGLISMIDPPRLESKDAVHKCIMAGIKPVMITGDHKVTAAAIAREIGIMEKDDIAVEGLEIDKLNDEQLKEKVKNIAVYARVSPEHKIRIVRAWQSLGEIVAMTGDGVNDAPALKQADIGVAMGITGTEVSKDAASVILTDDNFQL